jgi:general secretion pathway protein G
MSSKRSRGFTLVEVLIVVVIMAVLAAVVIPQFSSSTDDAKRSTAEFNLSTLRSIVQTYKAQHNATNPAHDATKKELPGLLGKTLANGTVDAAGPYGPYLVEFPENPYTQKKDVNLTRGTSPPIKRVAGYTTPPPDKYSWTQIPASISKVESPGTKRNLA